MQLTLAHIGSSRSGPPGSTHAHYDALVRLYLDRATPILPCHAQAFPDEAAFLAWLARPSAHQRPTPLPVLLHGAGRQLSSTEFAAWLGVRRDQGAQHIAFAIGPAGGWSAPALELAKSRGGLLLSFGPITMAHALARLVLAEQLYRACTILSGHPYHSGH